MGTGVAAYCGAVSERPTPTDGAVQDKVRGTGLSLAPLSVTDALAAVADPAAGGHALFVGTVRDHDDGRAVEALAYSAHPSAEQVLRRVAARVAAEPDVIGVFARHRLGDLVVGEVAVVVAVSTAHRADAFALCRALIDEVKAEVPIWKHQRFADGQEEWVGVP